MRKTSTQGSTGLLIIIIFAALVVIGGLLFSTGKEQQPVTENTPATEPVVKESRKMNITLQSLGNSLQIGEVVLREVEGKTSVTAVVNNFTTAKEQPIQIMEGTCTAPGELAYSLKNLEQNQNTSTAATDLGTSDTVLDVSYDDLLARGPLAIAVRKTPEEGHISVACGELNTVATTTAPVEITATTTPDTTTATTTQKTKKAH